MPGTLFVVATPIGNLEDLTFRALRTLREVDLIAAEDTRRTAKLLAHYQIQRPMVSLREHNETRETPRLLAHLADGRKVALVSDAGTPGIADPGQRLVRAARDAGFPVLPIPGPSAVAAALSVSGLPADQFVFMGFPPSSGGKRRRWLEALSAEHRAVVFFEAPHRVRRTISDVVGQLGERPIQMAREMTKVHEQYIIRPNMAIPDRGEYTILVWPHEIPQDRPLDLLHSALSAVDSLVNQHNIDSREAVELVASFIGVPSQALRKARKKSTIAVKQQKASMP